MNSLIETGMQYISMFACVLLLYFSILKCFWDGEKNRVVLFVVVFFTNPFLLYFGFGLIVSTFYVVINLTYEQLSNHEYLMTTLTNSVEIPVISTFIVMILQTVLALIVGKWLKTKHISLVVFVYLMFLTLVLSSTRQYFGDLQFDTATQRSLLSVADYVLSSLTMGLFYFLNIKKLSRLTSRPFGTSWRLFIIPPALYCIVYNILSYRIWFQKDIAIVFWFNVISLLVDLLFIWAFYVIIKNINATGDAIAARDEIKTLSVEVMEALAHTIDAKDEYTRGHSVRVAGYSRMIAQRMGLSLEDCENVYYMGLLHDIGKIGVPNEIINSPTRLTDEEYGVIKTHPGIGFDILAEIKSRPDLAIGARWHHERYDGGGYPDGIGVTNIPIFARIIAVADSYDAMTSNRSYRSYMPQDKVRSEIEKNAGSQFDPDVARCMLSIIDEDTAYTLHE
jgi:HD-GYP domain-containing protein (c-di-GMP phosphodiesterase class II)